MSSQISIKERMFDNYHLYIYIYISYLNDNEHEDDNNNDGDDIKKVWWWLIDGCYIDLIKYIQ